MNFKETVKQKSLQLSEFESQIQNCSSVEELRECVNVLAKYNITQGRLVDAVRKRFDQLNPREQTTTQGFGSST